MAMRWLGERTISRLDIHQPIQCCCNLFIINGNEFSGLVETLSHKCTQPVGITTVHLHVINNLQLINKINLVNLPKQKDNARSLEVLVAETQNTSLAISAIFGNWHLLSYQN